MESKAILHIKGNMIMLDIFKYSVSDLHKKLLRIFIIYGLTLAIIFGINEFDIKTEIFTVFIPVVLGIIFIDELKGKKNKNIILNFLINFKNI